MSFVDKLVPRYSSTAVQCNFLIFRFDPIRPDFTVLRVSLLITRSSGCGVHHVMICTGDWVLVACRGRANGARACQINSSHDARAALCPRLCACAALAALTTRRIATAAPAPPRARSRPYCRNDGQHLTSHREFAAAAAGSPLSWPWSERLT